MKLFIFIVLVTIVKSAESECNGSSPTFSGESGDSLECVCEQQVITINPLACSHFLPGISSNSSIVSMEQTVTRQLGELQIAVSTNLGNVSSELEGTKRKVADLQGAVSTNHEIVLSELSNTTQQVKDTILQVEELQVTVSGNHESVTSEMQGLKRQLEELQVSVSALVESLHVAPAPPLPPKDCSEILASGISISGVYMVQPVLSGGAFHVYCDMETDGGGWTVFQRRMDGSVDFYLDFASYSRGFGNLEGEFWLGNDNLHSLTAQGEYELRVDLSDFESESTYAVYDSFRIADASDKYRLRVGSYSGTAGDSLTYQNNQQFTTKDQDNDTYGGNCSQRFHGAWWFNTCHHSHLNGEYLRGTTTVHATGVDWRHWKGGYYSLKTSEMKIRPTQ